MTDYMNGVEEEGKEEERQVDYPQSSDNNYKTNRDLEVKIVNGSNESIPGDQYDKFYEQYLYRLLPAIYQDYDDKENNVLREFLRIIASQAVTIRRDIDGLLNNLFINSCDEWVIPYIADLIAARVVPNSYLNSNSSRLDVEKTMRWRKLKGTRMGLEDVISTTINATARVKEAFRYCSSSVHVGFSRNITDMPSYSSNFVNLRDQNTVNSIDKENDITPHLIDVREPAYTNGWYNIKNVLLFLPQLNVYHINDIEAGKEGNDDGLNYYFSSLFSRSSSFQESSSNSSSSPSLSSSIDSSSNNSFPLYDLDTGLQIESTKFAHDPFHYFGHNRGMTVKINNILAACPDPPDFSPFEHAQSDKLVTIVSPSSSTKKGNDDADNLNIDPDFMGLDKEEGIRLIESRKFTGSDKQFIIRLYSYSKHDQEPIEIGYFDTSKMFSKPYERLPLQRSRTKKIIPVGNILLSLESASKSSLTPDTTTTFPETVIAIRDSRPYLYARENDGSRFSKYKNALYVYLPAIALNPGEKKYLIVDTEGSTYHEVGAGNEGYSNNRLKGKLARQGCGQTFPPRQLTYSSQPLKNFSELNRFEGIKVVDTEKYKKGSLSSSFEIEGIAVDKIKNQAWKIGRLKIASNGSSGYVNEKEVWIQWTIRTATADNDYSKPSSNSIDRSPKEKESLVCHFKAIRLVLEKSPNLLVSQEIGHQQIRQIITDIMPIEILPENSLGDGIATYSIPEEDTAYSNKNTREIDVTVKVDPNYRIEEVAQKIRKAIEEKPELSNAGELVLCVSIPSNSRSGKGKDITPDIFPLSEIILTNSFGKSMLIYLPQLKFDKNRSKYYLYVASDGSTSFEESLTTPARESAGQVIPLAGKYPLQQRTPCYINLAKDWQSAGANAVHSGELAIDPEHGRFAFSRQDYVAEYNNADASMPVTADYNYAFSYDIGAGAYDRRGAGLKKATKWISKNGHVPYSDALPSRTFHTIVDALASAVDGDIIEIEDSCIYEEDTRILSVILNATIRNLTLQAANQRMPAIKLTEKARSFGVIFSHQTKPCHDKFLLSRQTDGTRSLTLDGIVITGGTLTLEGNFSKLVLSSCTIDPGYEDKRFLGVEIKPASFSASDTYATSGREKASPSREILLIRSITGGIKIDDSVFRLSLKDSIIDNLEGSAIQVIGTNEKEEPTLKLEAERSDILGNPQKAPVLKLKDICCSDVILTNRVSVTVRQDQDQTYDSYHRRITSSICGSIRHSRYEQGSVFKIRGENNKEIMDFKFRCVRCASESPIFISTSFGHPAYLHLDHLTSKSILEGAENTLEMGAFNKNDKPLRMRNLKIRLREFLPLGIKSGLVYLY